MSEAESHAHAGLSAFRHLDFTLYQLGRFFVVAGLEMLSVAVGWQVYEITRRPLDLGYVGLAQFLPNVFLFLLAGHAADRFNRKSILLLCNLAFAGCCALLIEITHRGPHNAKPIYVVLVLLGIVRSFNSPAGRSLLPLLVPVEVFPNAVAWNATMFQAATILGPALGGFLYALFGGPAGVYGVSVVACGIATVALVRIRARTSVRQKEEFTVRTVLAGLHYIWTHKLILGATSLDLFAVLLGGAVALLPVYAREILRTGPWGLGLLRASPGVGASVMAILLAYRPLRQRVGKIMLFCVAGFGVFTIVFGLSHSLVLSLISLVLVGASDMVSVVVRGTLVQIATPDAVRGRVNAVDMIFIGASNELGEFESGVTAHWFGTVPAVILGGAGTLIVVALWAWLFPELRDADKLTPVQAQTADTATNAQSV
ncbi:MAG: major facilitator superfamily transporter [Acidobacteriaceae bacterium]|nr:major facilitator superfamily transporter [Acidobacteriaceae bacterium]